MFFNFGSIKISNPMWILSRSQGNDIMIQASQLSPSGVNRLKIYIIFNGDAMLVKTLTQLCQTL